MRDREREKEIERERERAREKENLVQSLRASVSWAQSSNQS